MIPYHLVTGNAITGILTFTGTAFTVVVVAISVVVVALVVDVSATVVVVAGNVVVAIAVVVVLPESSLGGPVVVVLSTGTLN